MTKAITKMQTGSQGHIVASCNGEILKSVPINELDETFQQHLDSGDYRRETEAEQTQRMIREMDQ